MPNELMRHIMAIKYDNWQRLKKCVCGNHDFKACPIIECSACTSYYCAGQKGYSYWMWECRDCYDWFCGTHRFYITPTFSKICEACCKGAYIVAPKLKIMALPVGQVSILESLEKDIRTSILAPIFRDSRVEYNGDY